MEEYSSYYRLFVTSSPAPACLICLIFASNCSYLRRVSTALSGKPPWTWAFKLVSFGDRHLRRSTISTPQRKSGGWSRDNEQYVSTKYYIAHRTNKSSWSLITVDRESQWQDSSRSRLPWINPSIPCLSHTESGSCHQQRFWVSTYELAVVTRRQNHEGDWLPRLRRSRRRYWKSLR